MAIIKFSEEETKVKLDYDSGKETDNKFEEGKKQYMWSCNDGDVFYATPSLNTLLTSVGAKRGKVLSIRKKRLEERIFRFLKLMVKLWIVLVKGY